MFMPSDLIPGETLKSFSQHWKEFQASRGIRKLVKFGYKMKFDYMPKLTQPRAAYATSLPEEQMKVVRASVAEFVAKGAVRKLSNEEAKQKPGFHSKLFTVPKPNVTWSMIIDIDIPTLLRRNSRCRVLKMLGVLINTIGISVSLILVMSIIT